MFRSSLACFLTLFSLPALADVWTFETPSENIQCTVGEGFDENEQAQSDITCTIIDRSGPPALPRPNDCASGWGHVFSMRNRGPVQMECGAPSQDRGGSSRAEYGVTGEFVGITCHSSRQGLTCTNRDGNGFSLAKRRQAVFGPNVEQSAGPGSPKTISRAAAYLRDEQIGVACDGRGGTFEPGGLIERDLTGDGKDDLLIDHRGISCNGSPRSSLECGMQVCSMRIYVREGQLLRLKEDFLGMQPSIGNEQVPVIRVLGHGGGQAAIRWTGYGFERLQQPTSASNARPAYDPNARWGSYTGQGIREASVTSGPQNQLLLACDLGASPFGAGSSLSIEVGGDKAPAGSTGTMAFDGGQPIPVHFDADNSVQVENSNASIGQFNFIVSSLKRHSTVLVSLPNGKQARFSLRGSSRAIGNCPATPTARDLTAATAAAARPAASSKQGSGGSDNKFADYPPTAILNSAAKFPQFNGRDNAFRDYRTRLRDGVNAGVNFAGHYSFVTIGCGTSCRFAFVVDLRSGEVFDFPYGGEEQYQMDLLFFRDSRLVKVRWKGSWDGNTCSERDLAVEGTRWRVLAERTVPAVDDFCFYDPEEVENRGQFNDRDVSGTSSDTGPVTQPAPVLQIENVAKDASPVPGTGQGSAPQTIAGSESYEEDLRNQNQSHERYLKILGFDPGPVDGVTDASTTAAIIAFQQTNGLEVLGRLLPEHIGLLERQTEATLMAMAAPPSDSAKVISRLQQPSTQATALPSALVPETTGTQAKKTNSSPGHFTRTEKNGFVYYKLGACKHEKGLAITRYSFLDSPAKAELTDLCFDRKGGEVQAAEPVSNLTFVENLSNIESFEVIKPNTQSFQRTKVSAQLYRPHLADDEWATDSGSFSYHSADYNSAIRQSAQQHSVTGFVYKDTTPLSGVQLGNYQITIHVTDMWSHLNRASGLKRSGETPVVVLSDEAEIIGPVNDVVVKADTEADGTGDMNLRLEIAEDGQIEGSGTFYMTNSRAAGLNPTDWKIVDWKISNIVGYFVGTRGQEFRGLGFITGQTVDQDGFVHKSFGSILIQGYGPLYTTSTGSGPKQSNQSSNSGTSSDLEIEEQLKALGFDPGPVDGVVTEGTVTAIHAFQKQFGLPQSDALPPEQLIVLDAMVKARGN
ncbi:peptidoglycan-binding protein [Roseibium album]|uniref:peptidoglycan-binding protein n=1 Tax=Roseibium album TaxID=311410 RepID=UPI002492FB95|nr:peptidoglycan-binding protein [Roseibium album]